MLGVKGLVLALGLLEQFGGKEALFGILSTKDQGFLVIIFPINNQSSLANGKPNHNALVRKTCGLRQLGK